MAFDDSLNQATTGYMIPKPVFDAGKALFAQVAAVHGVDPEKLRTRKGLGREHYTAARRDFIVRAKGDLGLSLPMIGHLMGRHHTTVLSTWRWCRRNRWAVTRLPATDAPRALEGLS